MNRPLAFVGVDDGVELALIISAVLTVIILAALWIFTKWMAGLFGKVPVIGHYIASAFDWASRWSRGAMMTTLHGTLWALGKISHAIWVLIVNQLDLYKYAAGALIGAVEHTRFVVITREINGVRTWVIGVIKSVWNATIYDIRLYYHKSLNAVNALRTEIDGKLNNIVRTLTADIQLTRQQLTSMVNNAVGQLNTRIQALRATEAADVARLQADLQAGDARAVAQAVSTALAGVDTEAHNAAATIWPGLDTQITQLRHQLAADFPDVTQLLQVIPTAAPDTLALLLPALVKIALPTLQLATDCTVPTCRDLGPLRNLLHILAQLGFDAALLAWLVFCITEPATAAADTQAVLAALLGPVETPLRDLLGVP